MSRNQSGPDGALQWRRRLGLLLRIVAVAVVAIAAFEWIGGAWLRLVFRREFQLTVDHRPVPHSRPDINGDGIRCEHEAADFSAATTNVIFLGDSFTYGFKLGHASQSFPALVGQLLDPSGERVKTVNFGWPSSSPLLVERQLADIGARYSPDLVVMCLDLTDFYDDHKYARMIRFPRLSPTAFLLRELGLSWLIVDWKAPAWRPGGQQPLPMPRTFFVVKQPLAESRPYLDEIEGNLRRLERRAREELGSGFALVLLPRAFQYTDREHPNYKGAAACTPLGPYVLEPNRWFDEYCTTTGFRCLSLLEDFRTSPVFPTCYDDDPHWNPAGHQVAAQAIAEFLKDGL